MNHLLQLHLIWCQAFSKLLYSASYFYFCPATLLKPSPAPITSSPQTNQIRPENPKAFVQLVQPSQTSLSYLILAWRGTYFSLDKFIFNYVFSRVPAHPTKHTHLRFIQFMHIFAFNHPTIHAIEYCRPYCHSIIFSPKSKSAKTLEALLHFIHPTYTLWVRYPLTSPSFSKIGIMARMVPKIWPNVQCDPRIFNLFDMVPEL